MSSAMREKGKVGGNRECWRGCNFKEGGRSRRHGGVTKKGREESEIELSRGRRILSRIAASAKALMGADGWHRRLRSCK